MAAAARTQRAPHQISRDGCNFNRCRASERAASSASPSAHGMIERRGPVKKGQYRVFHFFATAFGGARSADAGGVLHRSG